VAERAASGGPQTPRRPDGARWRRHGEGLEFERAAFFTDAVFAIAMTLLIVAIAVPSLRHTTSSSDLLGALDDKKSEFIAFFIGFAVLGNYWLANHRFFGYLAAMSNGALMIAMPYLAFVAWLPFPTALLGTYDRNPVAVALFAASAAIVSFLEAMLIRQAQHDGLFRRPVPDEAYRHAMRASLIPVVSFVLSIPVAFADTYVAIAVWALTLPGEILLDRRKPTGFDEAFAGWAVSDAEN
jgi:uncharacterized membrane protein